MELINYYERGKLNGALLKIIAIVTMLADHTAAVLIDPLKHTDLYQYMRLCGRISFPIFCFLLVQGFIHTSNVNKYALRLLFFSIMSEVVYDYTFFGEISFERQNIFFTLVIGLMVLYVMKRWEHNTVVQMIGIAAGCLSAWLLRTDYQYLGILQIALIYNYRNFRFYRILSVIAINIALGQIAGGASLLFTEFYNGKRGSGLKYVFYIFYPLHLLVLLLIYQLMGGKY